MSKKTWYTLNREDLFLRIKVSPNADRNRIVGLRSDELAVRIKAQAQKGMANKELIKFLAGTFGISKSAVEIISGGISQHKVIRLPREAAASVEAFFHS